MVGKSKVIVKIMVLVLCVNTLFCNSTLAVAKSTDTVKANIVSEENTTEVTTGCAVDVNGIEEKNTRRSFNKKWMTAIFCGDLSHDYVKGKPEIYQNITEFKRNNFTLDQIVEELDNAKAHSVDSVTISIHIDLDPKTKKIIIGEDLDEIQKVFDEAKARGIDVEMLKIHYQSPWDGERIAYLSENEDSFLPFYDEYMRVIKIIAEKFKGQTKKFDLFNEFGLAYHTVDYKTNNKAYKDYSDKVIEMINETRAMGYEVGISTCGIDDASNIPEVVVNALDFLGVNWYPNSECIDYDAYSKDIHLNYLNDLTWFNEFKCNHPNKQLYITETGVEDYFGSLTQSQVHYQPQDKEKDSQGYYQSMNLRMLFETFYDSNIDGVCYWWFLLRKNTSTINVCNEFCN